MFVGNNDLQVMRGISSIILIFFEWRSQDFMSKVMYIIFYNIPSRFYSEWKNGCFQIDFYMPERYFSWHTYKQSAWVMKTACRLSIFLPEFLTFLQSLTSVESDIQRNKGESKGIWKVFEGIFKDSGIPFPQRPSSLPWRPSSLPWTAGFTLYENGRHGNEDGRQEKKPRTSWKRAFPRPYLGSVKIVCGSAREGISGRF